MPGTRASEIEGQKFTALSGGPLFQFTEAVSFVVNCETLEEVDHYWEKLAARRHYMKRILAAAVCLLLLGSVSIFARPPQQKQDATHARTADVESPDAIIAALYDVISGPAGQPRDWDRFRSLFAPGARLIPTIRNAQSGEIGTITLDPEGYIARGAARLEKEGFFEKEIARRAERFGNIIHAFSTYESRHKAEDTPPFARGINSIQLYSDGKRWWVVTVFWQAESPENQLPSRYLLTP